MALDHYTLIEDYLHNRLDPGLRESFLNAMAEDEVLRTTVEKYRTLQAVVEKQAKEDARIAVQEAAANADPPTAVERKMGINRVLRIAAVALVVIIAAAAIIANTSLSTNRLTQAFYLPPDDLTVNQSGTQGDVPYRAVISKWQSGDTEEAVSLGEAYFSANPGDVEFSYILAHIYFEDGQFAQSLQLFENLKSDQRYADEADFLTALCNLRLGNEEEAMVQLQRISNNPAHALSDESTALVGRLGSPLRALSFR